MKTCPCGRVASATIELLGPDGVVERGTVLDLCVDHTAGYVAKLLPTYPNGDPAFRVDRFPQLPVTFGSGGLS